MYNEDEMMVDDGSDTDEISDDEQTSQIGDDECSTGYFSRSSSFSAFSSFPYTRSLSSVPRHDSFSTSSSGTSDTITIPLPEPVFKEPFIKPNNKRAFEDDGLTPPLCQSPPSHKGYMHTSPYKTPPKRANSMLSASSDNIISQKECERLKVNLSDRFRTGAGDAIPIREKKRMRLDRSQSSENSPPNPSFVSQPAPIHQNPLSRSQPLLPINSIAYDRPITRSLTMPTLYTPALPIISNTDECQRISAQTLVDVIQKKIAIPCIIIDCRYNFEFEGGHIENAWHCPPALSMEILVDKFIRNPIREKVAIIFHCEFSSKRGPTAYKLLRRLDREMNTYPHLTYPDMYVLDGGYREFFSLFPDHCYPRHYIEMKDKTYKRQLAMCESERKKISRHNSLSLNNMNLRSSGSFHI